MKSGCTIHYRDRRHRSCVLYGIRPLIRRICSRSCQISLVEKSSQKLETPVLFSGLPMSTQRDTSNPEGDTCLFPSVTSEPASVSAPSAMSHLPCHSCGSTALTCQRDDDDFPIPCVVFSPRLSLLPFNAGERNPGPWAL